MHKSEERKKIEKLSLNETVSFPVSVRDKVTQILVWVNREARIDHGYNRETCAYVSRKEGAKVFVTRVK